MNNKIIKQLVVNAMFIALLVVSSFISLPINQVPYTLQLLIVFIILLTVNVKDALLIFSVYLIMGLIGLPVFSGFTSGITISLGYVIGFVISPIIYLFSNKIIYINNQNIKKFIICSICLIFIDIIATVYIMLYLDISFYSSLVISIFPYLLIDILKIIIAIIIQKRIILIYNNEE